MNWASRKEVSTIMRHYGIWLASSLLLLRLLSATSLMGAPSLIGLTGGLTVPSPVSIRPENYEFAIHAEGLKERNDSTKAEDTTLDLSMKLNAGVYDNFEIGLEKKMRSASDRRDDQMTVQMKYRLPVETFNLSLGTVLATSGRDYSSAYVVGGWKALYGGVGLNFGGQRLEELTLTQIRRFGTAKFGGYRLKRGIRHGSDSYIGEPEEFFAMFGADFRLSDYFNLIMDFNGDRFAAGFRLHLKDFNFDLAYVGQSETEALLDRDTMNFLFGAGVRF